MTTAQRSARCIDQSSVAFMRFALRRRRLRVFPRRRHVLRIQPAIVAHAPGALHALLEADEAAIAAAAAGVAAAQILAPRIVLRMRSRIQARRCDENSYNCKQKPHARPPGSALAQCY